MANSSIERRPAASAVVTSYGMSETCGGCVYDGIPLAGVHVELTNNGRILIKSPSLFTSYRLRPDLTAEALSEGRFTTQDLGRWEAGDWSYSGGWMTS